VELIFPAIDDEAPCTCVQQQWISAPNVHVINQHPYVTQRRNRQTKEKGWEHAEQRQPHDETKVLPLFDFLWWEVLPRLVCFCR